MLQAMNTGHEGSLSTCHANTPADALRRLETMILLDGSIPLEAVRDQLSAAVDLVVQIERRRDGSRFVTSVGEVDIAPGADGRVGVRPVAVDGSVVERLRRPPRAPAPRGTGFPGPAA